mmetsp:Transcript_5975/g.16880  ORF Transcript_5975/g.16880 Transcript_5975/m.16880 type:complete len:270 (+) Transcript_5975:922-1731(+)
MHVRDLLLELAADARDGAARARPGHQDVKASVRVTENLLCGAVVVRQRISGIDILVQNVRVRDLRVESVGHTNMALRAVPRRLGGRPDDLGAQGLEKVHLLARHLLRHRDDHLIAPHCRREGHADPRVAARGLNEDVPLLDAAGLLRIHYHAVADAVLDAATRVHELALHQDLRLDTQGLRDRVEPDQGSIPNELERGVVNLLSLGQGKRRVGRRLLAVTSPLALAKIALLLLRLQASSHQHPFSSLLSSSTQKHPNSPTHSSPTRSKK